MLQDLRHGIRLLLQNKAWTLVVVLSLALGIGANTALFGAINGLLLQTIRVDHPESIVRFRWLGDNQLATDYNEYGFAGKDPSGQAVGTTFSYPMYQQLRESSRSTLIDLFAGAPKGQLNVTVDGDADIARGFVATGNFFQLLGVGPIAGRTLRPDDDTPSANPVAVISEGFWNRQFGRDARAIGKVVRVNNTPVTIVGVVPASFTGIQQAFGTPADVTLPLNLDPQLESSDRLHQSGSWWLQVAGRLRPGVSAAQVQGSLDGVYQQIARSGWNSYLQSLTEAERNSSRSRHEGVGSPHLRVESAARGMYDASPVELQSLTIVAAVVALLLVIVCANVANLLLSRATARQKEISVRLSMGATRGRLIRQLLTESVLLAAVGGLAGVLVGYWSRQLLPYASAAAPFDWRLFAFVVSLTLATGVLFGIAPALRATGLNVSAALKENSRAFSRTRTRLSKALLVVQVAMSLVLLIGAGLFVTTLHNLRSVDVGFDPTNLLMFRVNPQLNRYDPPRIAALYAQILDRLGSLPGIRGASLSQPALLSGSTSRTGIFIEGHDYSSGRGDLINQMIVAPSFFQTLGIPLLTGRAFTDHDDDKAPRVAIVNEAAARALFGGGNPVGKRFGGNPAALRQFEVIGVVRDAKYNSLRDAAPPTLYWPMLQRCCPSVTFELRTAGDPSAMINAVRSAVRDIDPNLPLMNVTTQTEQVEARLAQERLFAQAYVLFGALALLVASIGLFGLMSYNVARRTNEIGIRMALGAQRRDVVGMVMSESMLLVVTGIAIGIAAAFAAGRLVATLLFGLSPTDPLTMASAVMVMALVSALAGYLPARRAARVDPMVALHYE